MRMKKKKNLNASQVGAAVPVDILQCHSESASTLTSIIRIPYQYLLYLLFGFYLFYILLFWYSTVSWWRSGVRSLFWERTTALYVSSKWREPLRRCSRLLSVAGHSIFDKEHRHAIFNSVKNKTLYKLKNQFAYSHSSPQLMESVFILEFC